MTGVVPRVVAVIGFFIVWGAPLAAEEPAALFEPLTAQQVETFIAAWAEMKPKIAALFDQYGATGDPEGGQWAADSMVSETIEKYGLDAPSWASLRGRVLTAYSAARFEAAKGRSVFEQLDAEEARIRNDPDMAREQKEQLLGIVAETRSQYKTAAKDLPAVRPAVARLNALLDVPEGGAPAP
jgi:hypothetical protein